jgi:type IV pilus assembly protein PilP
MIKLKPKPKRKNNYCLLLCFLFCGLLLWGGCNKEEKKPPHSHPKTPKNTPPPVQGQLSSAAISVNTPSSLDFSMRKDPFKSLAPSALKPAGSGRSADLLPIQSYELSKFKVAGIIVGLKENKALVIDPSGKGYVVKQGMLIGDSEGQITRITATAIEVLEKYKDDNGRIKSRTVKLTLPKKR